MLKDKLNISTVDIDLYRNHIYNKDKIKSLDVNSRFKRFRFFYNGLLLNLENITVRAYIIKPDNKEIFNDLTIIGGNIAELEFTNQALLAPGILKLELVLYEDDAELSSFLIEYEVIKSLRSDNSIESSNEYNSLQIALQKVELWNKNYQALYDKWNNDFNVLHANKSAILDNLKTTKENELNKLKIDKNNELETLHNTKESELNKLKSDKDNELTTLYNSKDEELTTLKNAWDEEFKKKYDGLNQEYSDRVVTLEDDILNSNSSESLLNENITSFKVGTGTINGVAKDYTNDMEQSLVTLNNIQGQTNKVQNQQGTGILVNQKINCIYTLDENDKRNYFERATSTVPSEVVRTSYSNNNINVTTSGGTPEWWYATYEVTGLTIGEVYSLTIDSINKESGNSAVTIIGDYQPDQLISLGTIYNDFQPQNSGNSITFCATYESVSFYFYCTLGASTGNITYNNVQLRKVKNYTKSNLTLRSVPNGAKDTLKNNIISRNIGNMIINDPKFLFFYESNIGVSPDMCAVRTTTGLTDYAYSDDKNDHIVSNLPSKSHGQWGDNTEGVHIGNYKSKFIYFNVPRVSNPDVSTFIENYLPCEINYIKYPKTFEEFSLSIVVNPGDTIYIDSIFPVTCDHTVQLNTKSQIEELQVVFNNEKRSVWSKMLDLMKFEFHISQYSYIKFPKVIGGLLFQFGYVQNHSGNPEVKVWFPLAFNERFNTLQITGQWSNSHDHYWVSSTSDYKTYCTLRKIGNYDATDDVYWFAIGR